MAKTYSDIQAQIKALEAKATELRKKESGDVVARIKEAIMKYQLTAADLGLGARATKKAVSRESTPSTPVPRKRRASPAGKKLGKAPVRFRDKNGNTWAGRGLKPRWLVAALAGGAKLESFRV